MNLDSDGWWILSVDGTSWKTGAGVGLQLKALTGERIENTGSKTGKRRIRNTRPAHDQVCMSG